MKLLSWNANGLGKGPAGQAKANWLLSHLDSHPDIAALAIQETHCQDVSQMAQAIHDMELKYTLIHTPATDGDTHAGILLVVSKEYSIESKQVLIEGRVLYVCLLSSIHQTNLGPLICNSGHSVNPYHGLLKSMLILTNFFRNNLTCSAKPVRT